MFLSWWVSAPPRPPPLPNSNHPSTWVTLLERTFPTTRNFFGNLEVYKLAISGALWCFVVINNKYWSIFHCHGMMFLFLFYHPVLHWRKLSPQHESCYKFLNIVLILWHLIILPKDAWHYMRSIKCLSVHIGLNGYGKKIIIYRLFYSL